MPHNNLKISLLKRFPPTGFTSKIYNFREYQMRVAISPHHTNPRSSTLDFWRKTTDIERYRVIQAQKKKQINIPTRFVTFRLFILKILNGNSELKDQTFI